MNNPTSMKAIVLVGHGDFDKLVYEEAWPAPEIGATEVLIKVAACGLNNTDVNTRSGWYSKAVTEATTGGAYAKVSDDDPTWGGAPISFPRIQGADPVGEIIAVGADVPEGLLGKRVMVDGWQRDWSDPENLNKARYFGSEMDGGFAELTKADYRGVAVVNSDWTDAELATIQCSYTTAEGMLTRANVGAGDTVLVPGASGGVGGAVVQISKMRGARVIAMTSPAKRDEVAAIGPDLIIDRAPDNLAELLSNEKVTVVADVVGGDYFGTLIEVLERGGRYTCSGAIAGPIVSLDLRTFYLNDLTFTGSTIVPLGTLQNVVKMIENNDIRPVLSATYRLKDLAEAQKAFIEKKHTGNIVVTM